MVYPPQDACFMVISMGQIMTPALSSHPLGRIFRQKAYELWHPNASWGEIPQSMSKYDRP